MTVHELLEALVGIAADRDSRGVNVAVRVGRDHYRRLEVLMQTHLEPDEGEPIEEVMDLVILDAHKARSLPRSDLSAGR